MNFSSRDYFVFWKYPYSFWRDLLTPILFQTIKAAQTVTSSSSIPSTKQPLHNCRRAPFPNLSHFPGGRTNRNVSSLKTKWGLPISHGITHLSQPDNLKTLPFSDGPFRPSQIKEASRQVSFIHDPKTHSPYPGDLHPNFGVRSLLLLYIKNGSRIGSCRGLCGGVFAASWP
jgi:hypothetical protein